MNIDPPVRFSTKVISGFRDGACVVIHVPRSGRAPHMVTEEHCFYTRREDKNVTMTVDDLRAAFLETGTWGERAREWIAKRTKDLRQAEGVPSLMQGEGLSLQLPRLYLHIGSVDVLLRGSASILVEDASKNDAAYLPFRRACGRRFNFDGVSFLDRESDTDGTNLLAYSIVMRNGWLEVARFLADAARDGLVLSELARDVVEQVTRSTRRFLSLELPPPFVVSLVLVDVQGRGVYCAPQPIDRRILLLPEVVLNDDVFENDDETPQKVRAALLPIFDQIAQAAGAPNAEL